MNLEEEVFPNESPRDTVLAFVPGGAYMSPGFEEITNIKVPPFQKLFAEIITARK